MTRPQDHIPAPKGEIFDRDDVETRIHNAVDDLLSDDEGVAWLHNQVCQGEVELIDEDEGGYGDDDGTRWYICTKGDDEEC